VTVESSTVLPSPDDERRLAAPPISTFVRASPDVVALARDEPPRVIATSAGFDVLLPGSVAGMLVADCAPDGPALAQACSEVVASGRARYPVDVRTAAGGRSFLVLPGAEHGTSLVLAIAPPAGAPDAEAVASALASLAGAAGDVDLPWAFVAGARALVGSRSAILALRRDGDLRVFRRDGVAWSSDGDWIELEAEPEVLAPAAGPAYVPDPIWIARRTDVVLARQPVYAVRPGLGEPGGWLLVALALEGGASGALLFGMSARDVERTDTRRLAAAVATQVERGLRDLSRGAADACVRGSERGGARDGGRPEPQVSSLAAAPPPLPEERIIGIVAHDLRTPLAAVDLAARLALEGGQLSARDEALVRRIPRSVARMARLLRDLLDFARVREAGGIPVARRAADLREVAEQAVRSVREAVPSREVRLGAGGPCPGEWDPQRLEQAITNLVQNAVQHSAGDAPVTVEVQCEDAAQARLMVRNSGAIPEDMMARLFQPFSADRTSRGLGLGLYIVAEIVRAHGGNVTARSTPQEGTAFTIELPRRGGPAAKQAPPH